MRLVIDSLIAMMLVAILAGVILHYRQQQRVVVAYQRVHQDLSQLRESIIYHSALQRDENNPWGFVAHVSPEWFTQGLPMNTLVSGRHPWMDIAPPGDMHDHPPDPVIRRDSQAGYWYNPTRGVIRARVPEQFTEHATLTLYNQINSTSLLSLPHSSDPSRTPMAHPQLQPVVASAPTQARSLADLSQRDDEPSQDASKTSHASEPAQDATPPRQPGLESLAPAPSTSQSPASSQSPSPSGAHSLRELSGSLRN